MSEPDIGQLLVKRHLPKRDRFRELLGLPPTESPPTEPSEEIMSGNSNESAGLVPTSNGLESRTGDLDDTDLPPAPPPASPDVSSGKDGMNACIAYNDEEDVSASGPQVAVVREFPPRLNGTESDESLSLPRGSKTPETGVYPSESAMDSAGSARRPTRDLAGFDLDIWVDDHEDNVIWPPPVRKAAMVELDSGRSASGELRSIEWVGPGAPDPDLIQRLMNDPWL